MKRYASIIPFSLFLILFSSCQKDCSKDKHSFTFETNKSIVITDIVNEPQAPVINVHITSGNELVFTYQFEAAQCESISDDEYSEFIHFSIDPKMENFNLEDADMTSINLVYIRGGAWVNERSRIEEGFIQGHKNSDESWDIDANFVLPLVSDASSKAAEIKATFRLK
jgi:hypothetical protein